jgi:hypothetical protein
VKLRLTIDVEYDLNGEKACDMAFVLGDIATRAAQKGWFTGDGPAEVKSWEAAVKTVDTLEDMS